MRFRLTFGALVVAVVALGLGCASSRREVRLQVDDGPVVVRVPENGGRRIELPQAELWGAFREAGREVVAQLDPLAAAEQTFGLIEQSGTYRYYVRSRRLVAESLGGGLAEVESLEEMLTHGYQEWSRGTTLGGSDCLRLLVHSRVLTLHGRYVVTLVMAMTSSFMPMLDSLKGLADPNTVAVTLASAVTMYLMLWLVPEPITKVIATSITVWLISYLGLDLFWSL
ncbi:MAG TPA: hypothetical protein VFU03_03225, partial [Gemmatimonadales bacterium]|nr:hypothetical protein [Gemmatimonadales bacterium]